MPYPYGLAAVERNDLPRPGESLLITVKRKENENIEIMMCRH
jgi:hypothetical protein